MISGVGRSSVAPSAAVIAAGVAAALLLTAAPSRAQWHAGFQGGATASILSGGAVRGADPALGAAVSVDVEHWLSPEWVLDMDAGLVQRGAANLRAGGGIRDVRLDYVELPVTLGRMFPIAGGWRWGPHAGIAVGWLRQCGVRSEGEFAYDRCAVDMPVGSPAPFNASVPVGLVVRHRYPGGSRLAVDLRYSRSLNTVLDYGGGEARSHGVQVLFGFTLPLAPARNAVPGGSP